MEMQNPSMKCRLRHGWWSGKRCQTDAVFSLDRLEKGGQTGLQSGEALHTLLNILRPGADLTQNVERYTAKGSPKRRQIKGFHEAELVSRYPP